MGVGLQAATTERQAVSRSALDKIFGASSADTQLVADTQCIIQACIKVATPGTGIAIAKVINSKVAFQQTVFFYVNAQSAGAGLFAFFQVGTGLDAGQVVK